MPPIPAPRESGYSSTTAIPLYWVAYGAKGAPQLLLLHGGPGADHAYLLPQLLELAKDHEVILYDQRGGGQSKTDDRTPTPWQTPVIELDSIICRCAIDPLVIVGDSWGALLALLFSMEAA